MASSKDLQDLLRLLTTGRAKLPMLQAMSRVKTLQGVGISSIEAIARADLAILKDALADDKTAKQLQVAAKSNLAPSSASKKRTVASSNGLGADETPLKRKRSSVYELESEPPTPQSLERSLALPQPSADDEEIAQTTVYTNRAPLVLAFAVSLLRFTMPEQPLSSRLSLAQAVVSVNSRSKAVSLGITRGTSAEQDGWGHGQPKIRVMGRGVHVLKRGGYEWHDEHEDAKAEEEEVKAAVESVKDEADETALLLKAIPQKHTEDASSEPQQVTVAKSQWAVSKTVTLKKSTFVARCIGVESEAQASSELQKLLSSTADLRTASHNITAWRILGASGQVREESQDDGESGGGRHVLGLLQASNLTNVLVVVTRWYGGIMLGTDRWRLMSDVCRDALSQRLRVTGTIGQEALWGLDLETMRGSNAPVVGGTSSGMPIYKPEGARAYILKAFATAPDAPAITADSTAKKKKTTGAALEREKEQNLGLLFGALDKLYGSWVEHISRDELDRRAWGWYVQVRPKVESGVGGWGGKGEVKLKEILDLRRTG